MTIVMDCFSHFLRCFSVQSTGNLAYNIFLIILNMRKKPQASGLGQWEERPLEN